MSIDFSPLSLHGAVMVHMMKLTLNCSLSVLVLLATLLFSACQCGGGVDVVGNGYRLEPDVVDFGRALAGQKVTRSIRVIAESRSAVQVKLSATGPFTLTDTVEVPGASTREVEVTFTAAEGQFEETATAVSGDLVKTVTLKAEGLRGLNCVPTAPCRVSTYSIESNTCVESQAADDSACEPTSLCLERGQCKAGQCLGVARNCDDGNRCTVDGCAPDIGCVHAPVQCPRPTKPCEVAVCSVSSGCGTAPAPDFALCGSVNCDQANVCLLGQCKSIDTPEGFKCGEAIACLPEARCEQKKCVRPDAGEWLPEWVQDVAGQQSQGNTSLVESNGALYFTVCGLGSEVADAGETPDASVSVDVSDAGSCALVSYTSTGFERFVTRLPTGETGSVLSGDLTQVLVALDAGVWRYSPTKGLSLDEVAPRPLTSSSLATASDWALTWLAKSDGGISVWSRQDGGTVELRRFEDEYASLAIDSNGTRWLGATTGKLYAFQQDGGSQVLFADAGATAFSVSRTALSPSATQLLTLTGDVVTSYDVSAIAGRYEPLSNEMLLSDGLGLVFFERCPNPLTSCMVSVRELWARAIDLSNGSTKWDTLVGKPGTPAALRDAVLVDVPGDGVASLVTSVIDGTPKTELSAIVDGKLLGACQVDAPGTIRSTRITPTQLVVTSQSDAGLKLYAYPLGAFPYRFSGWSTFGGQSGQRRAQ